jgi:glycosyltransferase involved in cell wall biosynthesis
LDIATAAYNEEETIELFINKFIVVKNLYSDRLNLNLYITNDGSQDRTQEIIESKINLNSAIKLFNLVQNMGAGFAMSNSCTESSGHFVLLIDSDNQYDLKEIIENFLKNYSEKVPIYFGQRNLKITNFGPYITKFAYAKIFPFKNRKISDYSCVVKIIKKDILNNVKLEARRMNYSNELSIRLLNTNYLYQTFHVFQHKRHRGISKTRFIFDAVNRVLFTTYLRTQITLQRKGIIFE